MIPKVIHYCWFGSNKKSKLIRDCIASWKSVLPDYEIKEWNEKNSDLTHQFVKDAYELKKWAFVSDYIRLKVLHDYGGIYLDTDMLVLKNFDDLLDNKCFFGAEDKDFISCGIIGVEPNYYFVKKCLNFYDNFKFSQEVNLGINTIPRIITEIFRKEFNFNLLFNKVLFFNGIAIYPSIYFYPLPFLQSEKKLEYKEFIVDESYAIHLWNSSWIEYSEYYYIRKRKYRKGLIIIITNILHDKKLSYKYLRKIASCFKESINFKNE